MLHDTYRYSGLESSLRGTDRTRWVDPEHVRLNPWLRWRPERPAALHVLTVADLAECHCPDLCNRDHGND
jgi:hypothetical protein